MCVVMLCFYKAFVLYFTVKLLTNCAHFLPNTEVLTCIKNKLPVPPIPSEQKLETNKKKKHCPDPDSNPREKGETYQLPRAGQL